MTCNVVCVMQLMVLFFSHLLKSGNKMMLGSWFMFACGDEIVRRRPWYVDSASNPNKLLKMMLKDSALRYPCRFLAAINNKPKYRYRIDRIYRLWTHWPSRWSGAKYFYWNIFFTDITYLKYWWTDLCLIMSPDVTVIILLIT